MPLLSPWQMWTEIADGARATCDCWAPGILYVHVTGSLVLTLPSACENGSYFTEKET